MWGCSEGVLAFTGLLKSSFAILQEKKYKNKMLLYCNSKTMAFTWSGISISGFLLELIAQTDNSFSTKQKILLYRKIMTMLRRIFSLHVVQATDYSGKLNCNHLVDAAFADSQYTASFWFCHVRWCVRRHTALLLRSQPHKYFLGIWRCRRFYFYFADGVTEKTG